MYLNKTVVDKDKIQDLVSRYHVPFTQQQIDGAVSMEIHSSSFTDPGPDFNEYRLTDSTGKVHTHRKEGY